MRKTLRCECGFEAEGSDDESLVASAKAHAQQAHNVELGAEQILSLARPDPRAPSAPARPKGGVSR
jgi:predicted small metal-binding protein